MSNDLIVPDLEDHLAYRSDGSYVADEIAQTHIRSELLRVGYHNVGSPGRFEKVYARTAADGSIDVLVEENVSIGLPGYSHAKLKDLVELEEFKHDYEEALWAKESVRNKSPLKESLEISGLCGAAILAHNITTAVLSDGDISWIKLVLNSLGTAVGMGIVGYGFGSWANYTDKKKKLAIQRGFQQKWSDRMSHNEDAYQMALISAGEDQPIREAVKQLAPTTPEKIIQDA